MDVEQTIADLAGQADWYGKLLKLAELQHTLVEQERWDDLLVVLNRRERIVEALAAIEQRLKPIKLDWHGIAATLAASDRSRVEEKFAEVRKLLELITRADCDDALVMQQRKITVGQQLRATSAGRQVNRGYAQTAYAGVGGRVNVSQ